MGVARISIPVGPFVRCHKGMMNYLDVIKDGIAEGRTDLVVPFGNLKELIGFNKYRDLEKKFLPEYIHKALFSRQARLAY